MQSFVLDCAISACLYAHMTDENKQPGMRISATITGNRSLRVRQVMAINGFRSENEAVQYLINRGLEQCSGAIRQWDMLREVQERTLASQADMFANMATILENAD